MKTEYSPQLIERCDEEFEGFFNDCADIFDVRINYDEVPRAWQWCQEYNIYLGARMVREGIGLKDIKPAWNKAVKVVDEIVETLGDSTRFVLDCHKFLNDGRFYTDDEI